MRAVFAAVFLLGAPSASIAAEDSHDQIEALTSQAAIHAENGDYASSVLLLQQAIDISRKLDGR